MIFETIHVDGVYAIKTLNRRIPAGITGAQVRFEFGPMWDGLTKTAVFRGCCTKDVLNIDDTVTIPPEVVAKPCSLQIGIYGVDGDGNATPTFWTSSTLVSDAANPSGDTSTDPSLPVWKQIQDLIGDLDNLDTAAKDSVVSAINEVLEQGGGVDEAIIRRIVVEYLITNPPDADGIMEGGINMNGQKLTGLNAPTADNEAANKRYVDDADKKAVQKSGDVMTGTLGMSGNRITGLCDPVENSDAASKGYVDTKTVSVTLLASRWSANAPYTQTVNVDGLTDALKAKAYPVWPEALEDKLALSEETAKIRTATRSGSTMTFECWEDKPALDIPVTVEVYV